jgi:hypothetical protein
MTDNEVIGLLRELYAEVKELDPGYAAVPEASRKTWAGRNYMSGWNQMRNRALRSIERAATNIINERN